MVITPVAPEVTSSVGSEAPDAVLTTIEGTRVSLSEYWAEKTLVVVFLRHIGCIFCRQQVAELRASYKKFQALNSEVVCIAQGDAMTGKAFSLLFDLSFPLLMCGEDIAVFRSYGLLRGTLSQLFGISSITRSIRAALSGHRQGSIVGDGMQMPGVFVIDTKGIIRYARRHQNAGDNPPPSVLLQAVREIVKE